MNYPITWQDFLCRFNLWHRYGDWQNDTLSWYEHSYTPVQIRSCFNCHWNHVRRIKYPKRATEVKFT